MGDEFVTFKDLAEAENRINNNIRDTERLLRKEYLEQSEKLANGLNTRIDKVDEHLDAQDALLLKDVKSTLQKWKDNTWWFGGSVAIALVLHYVFHFGSF